MNTKKQKKQWGRWTLDPTGEYPSLDIPSYGKYTNHPYQVRLFQEGCALPDFTKWLGYWVKHLQDKSWITPEDLWSFVNAAQDIHVYGSKDAAGGGKQ